MALQVALLAGALSACTQGPRAAPRQVVARFSGVMDPGTGKLTLTRADGLPAGIHAAAAIPDVKDGTAGSGPDGTVELVTEAIRTGQAGCGRADSVCADVTIRSFYPASELHNVFVQLTVTPTENKGFSNTIEPRPGQPNYGLTSSFGALWAYPALLDRTRGDFTTGTVTPKGANAATRTWYFNNYGYTGFTFSGTVYADVVPVTPRTDLLASCTVGSTPTPTSLETPANCGECGRVADGTGCAYAFQGSTQGTARFALGVTCTTGTACDHVDSMALTCTDLQSDVANCGVCRNSCGANSCAAGVCTGTQTCTAPATACGTGCCPAGSTCVLGECILSDAGEVAVGGAHACATTLTSSRIPYQTENGTALFGPNNVVCWGKSWANKPNASAYISPTFSSGVPVPQSGLVSPLSDLRAGGTSTHGYNPGAPDALAIAWGTMAWLPTQYRAAITLYGNSTMQAVGGSHACHLLNTLAFCRGANGAGQLGDGTTIDSGANYIRVRSVGGTTGDLWPADLSAAGDTSCAVLSSAPGQTAGTVACWGANTGGKAGATGGPYLVPRLVESATGVPLTGIARVSVGANHTVALTTGGDLVFWGLNDRGLFGAATAAAPALVTAVSTGGTATAVSAGQDFTCFLRGDATVWCTGANGRGQLGDGTTTDRAVFTQVIGLTGATSVSAGGVPATGNAAYGGACATVPPNVYCWGDNTVGQVGAGTGTAFYSSPILVRLKKLPAP